MKFIKVILAAILLAILVPGPMVARGQSLSTPPSVTLAWDASPDATVTGYHLYYGDVTGALTNQVEAGPGLTATVSNLLAGVTYFFFATAYDATGAESEPSNLITYTPTDPEPDLVIVAAAYSPADLVEGDRVQFSAIVSNRGPAAISSADTVRVSFSVNGQPAEVWFDFTDGLPPGGSATVIADHGSTGSGTWVAVAGLHTITARVDALGAVAESDEANNEFQFAVPVNAAPPPLVWMALDKTTVSESDGAGVWVMVYRSGNLTGGLNVGLKLEGSAQSGVDYEPLPEVVVLPAGSNAVSLHLIPLQNGVVDEGRTVNLSLRPDASYQIGSPGDGTIVITNVDEASDGDENGDEDKPADPYPPQSVTLAWDASPDETVTGYNLYHGRVDGTVTNKLDVGPALTATVSNLQAGVTYFFFATAYDANGTESEPSNFVIYTPTPALRADLAIASVSYLPASPVAGSPVQFSAVIVNQGAAALSAGSDVRVSFSVNEEPVVVWGVLTDELLPGATTMVTAGSNWTAVAGAHLVTATVNDPGVVLEADESNNELRISLSVTPAPLPAIRVTLDRTAIGEADARGVTITISRSGSDSEALSVGLELAGSARNGVDYAPLPDAVVMPAGANGVSLQLIPIHNGMVDEDRTVLLSLRPDAAYQLESPASGMILIADQDGDSDGDGMSDAAEFLAGTDPNDPDSSLKIIALRSEESGQMTLDWASVPGMTYRVMSQNSLTDGERIPASPLVTASETVTRWSFPATNAAAFFSISWVPGAAD